MTPLVLWFLADLSYMVCSNYLPIGKNVAITITALLVLAGVLCVPAAVRTLRNL